MKKRIIALALSALMVTGLVGCGSNDEGGSAKSDLKVGMVTDSGTIDDKSFNQGTWEGVENAKKNLGVTTNYLKPNGEIEAEYLKEIANHYDAGYKFIVTPGFKFNSAIYKAQDKYKDAKFVLIDGAPNNGKEFGDPTFEEKVGENAVSIFFAEHEAGFAAGVATALQVKEGDVGFIGGLKIPAVQKFNWGFQQGVKYANDNLGTSISMKEENFVYQGTFTDKAAGQQLAAKMYDRGVKAIFCAAGGVGIGVIDEAKARALKGDEAWVVGVDVDQYQDGIYGTENKSVVLTSAMKMLAKVTEDMIKDEIDGKFQGGKTLIYDAKNDGVGIPKENKNLSEETQKKTDEIFGKVKSGDIVVADKADGLIEPK
ncbi:MAG: BMP family lipoprotein [Clostridium sp.]